MFFSSLFLCIPEPQRSTLQDDHTEKNRFEAPAEAKYTNIITIYKIKENMTLTK